MRDTTYTDAPKSDPEPMLVSRFLGAKQYGDRVTLTEEDENRESAVSQFFHDLRDNNGRTLHHLLRQPVRTLRAAHDLLRLPLLRADVDPNGLQGGMIHRALAQRHTLRRFLPHAAVLVLPPEPGGYLVGPRRQTVRRMVRKAQRSGVRCAPVDDVDERRALLRLADAHERSTANVLYRNPDAVNDHLLDIGCWLVAQDADGRPLVLSITPVRGEWALLRYFRTLADGPEHTLARYALTAHLAEHLAATGVRYLFDETSPARLSNGLRHYQRMVGFRLYRTRLTTPRCAGTARP